MKVLIYENVQDNQIGCVVDAFVCIYMTILYKRTRFKIWKIYCRRNFFLSLKTVASFLLALQTMAYYYQQTRHIIIFLPFIYNPPFYEYYCM